MDAKEIRIFIAVLMTALVLGLIITYFIISLLRHQRNTLRLHKLSIIAEITQIEKERTRIAHDLHDEMGPLLSAVKMKINSFELSDEDDKIQIEKTNHHIDDILKRIREISFDLMPTSLLRKGVAITIKEFVDFLNNNNGATKFYFICTENMEVTEQQAINIYRIIQEIVHNTIKHAKATELRINLKKDNKNIILQLTDDGTGFNYEKESKENIGFGLKSLLRRIQIIDGKMFLDSKPGKGTSYTFEIPLLS